MNVLFIVESYIENPNPNGICSQRIIDELVNQACAVTVLTTKTSVKQKKHTWNNSVEVFAFMRSLGFELILRSRLYRGIKEKCIKELGRFIQRAWLALSFLVWPLRSALLSFRYYRRGKKIVAEKGIDAVIGVYAGIDEVFGAYLLKKKFKNLRFIIYTLDAMSGRKYPRLFGTDVALRSIKRWEQKVFRVADDICIMKSHEEHYKDPDYTSITDRIRVMDIPLFSEVDCDNQPLDIMKGSGRIRIVYTGAMLEASGNPCYFAEELMPYIQICELHLYGRLDDSVRQRLERNMLFNQRVFYHGTIPFENIRDIQTQADCLITFGSDNPNMIPCKIFEYFSTHRPVINVYNVKNDSAFPYVEKYPLNLQLNAFDKRDYNVTRCKSFFDHLASHTTCNSDLQALYWNNTPYPMAQLILNSTNIKQENLSDEENQT